MVPLVTSGLAIAGAGAFIAAPPSVPSIFAAAVPSPVVQSHDVQLTATGGFIGAIVGFFIGNGQDAAGDCIGSACNGGNGGILIGNGGDGANGGKGGDGGLLFGNGGNGGNGNVTSATFGLSTDGGDGGRAGLFGNAGNGGDSLDAVWATAGGVSLRWLRPEAAAGVATHSGSATAVTADGVVPTTALRAPLAGAKEPSPANRVRLVVMAARVVPAVWSGATAVVAAMAARAWPRPALRPVVPAVTATTSSVCSVKAGTAAGAARR